MNFTDIKLEHKEIIEKYFKAANLGISEHCFTSIYMWQEYYLTQFYEDGEFLYIKSESVSDHVTYYMCPVGKGDVSVALNKLFDKFGDDIYIISITDEMKERLEAEMPRCLEFEESRSSADYVHLTERLITLSGKKLHSKRNFVNRFIAEHGDNMRFELITSENKHKAWEFHGKWHKESANEAEDISLIAETLSVRKLLDNYEALGAIGGLLFVGDEVVGYTIATKSTEDLAVIHIEKCDVSYAGVYQMINNCSAKMLADVKYINREDDIGIEGLRKAKMSYRPDILRMKYIAKKAKIESDLV